MWHHRVTSLAADWIPGVHAAWLLQLVELNRDDICVRPTPLLADLRHSTIGDRPRQLGCNWRRGTCINTVPMKSLSLYISDAAKFGWCPILDCRAATMPRRETRWNLQGCLKLANRSQPLVGQRLPYCGDHKWSPCLLTYQTSIVCL